MEIIYKREQIMGEKVSVGDKGDKTELTSQYINNDQTSF